jgi:hypothetical protein
MASEFVEHDFDTPTESDLDQAYGSKFLSAGDVGNRKIRTTIVKVRKVDLRGSDAMNRVKFILHLEGIDKPMVVNSTNMNELIERLGRKPANWISAHVGLSVDPNVTYSGKRVGGLRLRVIGPSTTAKTAGPPEPQPHDGSGIEDMSDSIPS